MKKMTDGARNLDSQPFIAALIRALGLGLFLPTLGPWPGSSDRDGSSQQPPSPTPWPLRLTGPRNTARTRHDLGRRFTRHKAPPPWPSICVKLARSASADSPAADRTRVRPPDRPWNPTEGIDVRSVCVHLSYTWNSPSVALTFSLRRRVLPAIFTCFAFMNDRHL
ncbi:hypothetical protein OH77DRAFT_712806 [Trametes cingulata]|nr:hypothetical protein OH77DRAFT_712806 [Trametes cingulata]